MTGQTVLVTGASGYIAKHIVHQLLDAGYAVVGTVRSLSRGEEATAAVRPHLASDADLDTRLRYVALDLSTDDGWSEAMEGIDILMHTASPFPLEQPKDEEEVIRPAVDGTLRALRAAKAAGIKRVVLTSSVASIMNKSLPDGRTEYTEEDWTDLNSPTSTPYVRSKTLAEQAAWDFVKDEAPELELTVINPAFVLGPPMDNHMGTSMKVVERVLSGKDPAVPNFGFPCVDVRDIATMHVRALSKPDSIGKRIGGAARFVWFLDMARILKAAYPDRKIATKRAPNWLVKFLSLFDKAIKSIVPILGREQRMSNQRARDILGIDFIDPEESVRLSADYLLKNGLVK